ncbi:MAG: dihydropteroate synthase [Proteobacteria bacterium]|nr:dihydropteroate synthase [Pseudomonadota bacterium]
MQRPSHSCSVMGIINLTPDSFSDGGCFDGTRSADLLWQQVREWIQQGVKWIDLGAESTRPQSRPISDHVEWQRLSWALDVLASKDLGQAAISIDSYHHATQLKALSYPQVQMINCIYGATDIDHLKALKKACPGLSYVAMHMHGSCPATMQQQPLGEEEVLAAVCERLKGYHELLIGAGYKPESIYLDCGIGFGKTVKANLKLIEAAPLLADSMPLAYGLSRKSFLGSLLAIDAPCERDSASKILEIFLIRSGVKLIRTHAPGLLLSYLNA